MSSERLTWLAGGLIALLGVGIHDRAEAKRLKKLEKQKMLHQHAQEKFWEQMEVGKTYTGTVKSILDFGAFVDLGFAEGLVHISELSWDKIEHPSDVVKVGDVISVYIKDFDKDASRISLGHKRQEDNPWVKEASRLNIGDEVECEVFRILAYGAYVRIAKSVTGFIPTSEISKTPIDLPTEVLKIGETVTARVTDILDDIQQINLSMK